MKYQYVAIVLAFLAACGAGSATAAPAVAPDTTPQPAVVLFSIGMHIEPFGAQVSNLVPGATLKPANPNRPDYNNLRFFQNHVQDLGLVAGMVERHGGRMTVQAQSAFTTVAVRTGSTILADLEKRGHEIGLHFHEDAHLGEHSESLPAATWCAVMKEEIAYIHQAGVQQPVRYWSGGNLYPGLLEAAECTGLTVNSDWKNPQTQSTDPRLIGLNPWRPAGGSNGADVTLFAQHDPDGAIIFLPEGSYRRPDFASMRRSTAYQGDEAYFQMLAESLRRSVAEAQPGKVNVFHFTLHPGEFRGDPSRPFQVLERFLAEVVDPLVKEGKVQWATFSQMADAYVAWEAAHPVEPSQK